MFRIRSRALWKARIITIQTNRQEVQIVLTKPITTAVVCGTIITYAMENETQSSLANQTGTQR